MLKSDKLGQYHVSFFSIELNTAMEPIKAINDPSKCCIFIHEYIHFLQDIILPYTILVNLKYMYIFMNSVSSFKSSGVLRRPVKDDESVAKEYAVRIITWGANNLVSNADKIIDIRHKVAVQLDDVGPNKETANVFAYYATLQDKDLKKVAYQIGAKDFLEYIADQITQKFFAAPPTPVIPYHTVDLIFDHLGLDFVPSSVKMSIVEASLYNDNPMNRFFFIIDAIRNQDLSLFTDCTRCQKFLSSIIFASKGGRKETMAEKSNRRLKQFSNYLINSYDPESIYGIKQWIDHLQEYVVNNTQEFFFTELFMMNQDDFIKKIDSLYSQLGTPIVYNQNKQLLMSIPYTDDIENFIVFICFEKFLQFIKSDKPECPMLEFCQKANASPVTNECLKLDFLMRRKTSSAHF